MPFLLLDRDGVLNQFRKNDYVKEIEEFIWNPNAIKALQTLQERNFEFLIITNQSCINRNIITQTTLNNIHDWMKQQLKLSKVNILDIFVCPHIDADNCQCRKPLPGLLDRAMKKYNIAPEETLFVGDSGSDLEAGHRANVKTIAISSGNPNLNSKIKKYPPLGISENLYEAVPIILDYFHINNI